MSVMFRAMYRLGFKPWDSGVSPPELKELVEGPGSRKPGKALDLGCGTGTNVIYMAQHGWDVIGIDFTPRAITMAKEKAATAHVSPRFIVGDVTRLQTLGIGDGFEFVLDLGCLHSIPDDRRDAYVAGVTAVTVPGADLLIWAFYEKPSFFINAVLTREDVERRFAGWEIARVWGGEQPNRFPGRWYHLKRRAG
jgi:ubiquinone/menaquinone biosynthesis C-methylase UbiE